MLKNQINERSGDGVSVEEFDLWEGDKMRKLFLFEMVVVGSFSCMASDATNILHQLRSAFSLERRVGPVVTERPLTVDPKALWLYEPVLKLPTPDKAETNGATIVKRYQQKSATVCASITNEYGRFELELTSDCRSVYDGLRLVSEGNVRPNGASRSGTTTLRQAYDKICDDCKAAGLRQAKCEERSFGDANSKLGHAAKTTAFTRSRYLTPTGGAIDAGLHQADNGDETLVIDVTCFGECLAKASEGELSAPRFKDDLQYARETNFWNTLRSTFSLTRRKYDPTCKGASFHSASNGVRTWAPPDVWVGDPFWYDDRNIYLAITNDLGYFSTHLYSILQPHGIYDSLSLSALGYDDPESGRVHGKYTMMEIFEKFEAECRAVGLKCKFSKDGMLGENGTIVPAGTPGASPEFAIRCVRYSFLDGSSFGLSVIYVAKDPAKEDKASMQISIGCVDRIQRKLRHKRRWENENYQALSVSGGRGLLAVTSNSVARAEKEMNLGGIYPEILRGHLLNKMQLERINEQTAARLAMLTPEQKERFEKYLAATTSTNALRKISVQTVPFQESGVIRRRGLPRLLRSPGSRLRTPDEKRRQDAHEPQGQSPGDSM